MNRFSEKLHLVDVTEVVSLTADVGAGRRQAAAEASSDACFGMPSAILVGNQATKPVSW
jgi:hypothetical protein